MKVMLRKFMALSMALIVLMTTTSFTVAMHYCGDTLVNYSFTHKAEGCGMEKAVVPTNCDQERMQKTSCCSDQQLIIDGQDELQDSFQGLHFEQAVFITAFTYGYCALFDNQTAQSDTPPDYPPPFLKRDVQVLHQTFLI